MFLFLSGTKSGAPSGPPFWEKKTRRPPFGPIMYDTTCYIFVGSGNPILSLFLRYGIKVTLILG